MIGAIDIGTTTIKAMIFNPAGEKLATASRIYALQTLAEGLVEQDAHQWWTLSCETMKACLDAAGQPDIECLCLSAQGGSLVPVGADGLPLAPAATWMDTRGSHHLPRILEQLDQEWFYHHTGGRLSEGTCLTKILDFLPLQPRLLLTTLDFVQMKMTGRAVIDPTSAFMTGLLDIHTGSWQKKLLKLCRLDPLLLPTILPTGTVIGPLLPEAARQMGLTSDTLVINGSHDQCSAATGAGILSPGDVLLSTGSAWVVFAALSAPGQDAEFHTGPHAFPGLYSLFSSTPTGGVALDWVRNRFCDTGELGYKQLDQEVTKRMAKNPRLIVEPSFYGGHAVIRGLDLCHDRYDIALATMEGVIFEARLMLEKIAASAGTTQFVRLIGGAAKARTWQTLIRSIIGDISIFTEPDMACVGAAIIGGLAMDIWQDARIAAALLCRRTDLLRETCAADYYQEKYYNYIRTRKQYN